eukprot:scaffold3848_cov198-Alexandrium_tamarense.AAC.13
MAEIPLLALPAGSLLQFLTMTLPLLAVYLYFLYLVITRPNIANPNDTRYMDDRIRLTDILYTFLSTMVLFASLAVYLLWFVNKRRKLSKRYESDGIVVLGNVEFKETYNDDQQQHWTITLLEWIGNGFRRNDYGYVVYDLARVANHPACNYEERKQAALAGTIRKKVRVYYRYPREQVSIMVLPEYPYSGQPKIDLEADWASFSEQVGLPEEDTRRVDDERVDMPQIGVVDEYYNDESAEWAWLVFWVGGCGIVPLLAFGGNWIRWKLYQRWILRSGKKVVDESYPEVSSSPRYVQMT